MDETVLDLDVRDNLQLGRFEVSGASALATLDYLPEQRLVLARTHVPPSLDEPAHRLAGELIRAAIARARADRLIVVASCPFVRRWLRDNPDACAGVTVDWCVCDRPSASEPSP